MKIFITGATGFIGKQVLEVLEPTDHQLLCLVRKGNPNIEQLRASGISVFEGDVREKTSVLHGMKGCQWVINLANVYSFREMNRMIREISGISLPLIKMPDLLAMSGAFLITRISDVIKKPPIWGMSEDQMKTMRAGFEADGSKAGRELGIVYTPVRTALEEQIRTLLY